MPDSVCSTGSDSTSESPRFETVDGTHVGAYVLSSVESGIESGLDRDPSGSKLSMGTFLVS